MAAVRRDRWMVAVVRLPTVTVDHIGQRPVVVGHVLESAAGAEGRAAAAAAARGAGGRDGDTVTAS